MKRILILAFLLLLLTSPALAEQRVFDRAGLLSSATEARLEEEIAAIGREKAFEVVVATVPDTNGKRIEYFAADFYDYGGFGYTDSKDGILLLIVSSTRAYYMLNTGSAERIFGDSALDDIEEEMLPALRRNDYDAGAEAFVRVVGRTVAEYTPLNLTMRLLPLIVLGGLVIGGITVAMFRASMRMVRRQYSASKYVRQGSFRLTRAQDIYLYTTTQRVRIVTNNSRGGGHSSGGFHGSSGVHHTGRGGHF